MRAFQTLYIDVYFLINFTVDILSLHFAAMLSKTASTTRRLIIASVLGSLVASAVVFLPEIPILKLGISVVTLIAMTLISCGKRSLFRRVKFLFAFVIFEALVGGGMTLVWGIFDKYLRGVFSSSDGGAVNRKMLFFSLIVLLSIGVFKMLVSFFSNIESEGSLELEIAFSEQTLRLEAFVDSGNLAKDPMDMAPVLLLKKERAAEILPEGVIELTDPDSLPRSVRKRIRLIPISRDGTTHVLVGIKPDSVNIIKEGKTREINVTVAIDKEGGTFGGYFALIPSCALDDVTFR